MPCYYSAIERPELPHKLGVCILQHPGERAQRHVGIVYFNDEWKVLHLAGHNDLRNDPLNVAEWPVWVRLRPVIPDDSIDIVAASCRLIAKRHDSGRMPYAFSKPQNWFRGTGELVACPDNVGLTCASFIVAVFHDGGAPLVNQATWQNQEDDNEFYEYALAYLNRQDPAHAETARLQLPSPRYRPEEVAAAATCDALPADYLKCQANAANILNMLRNRN